MGPGASACTWASVPRTLEVPGSSEEHGPKDQELEDNVAQTCGTLPPAGRNARGRKSLALAASSCWVNVSEHLPPNSSLLMLLPTPLFFKGVHLLPLHVLLGHELAWAAHREGSHARLSPSAHARSSRIQETQCREVVWDTKSRGGKGEASGAEVAGPLLLRGEKLS